MANLVNVTILNLQIMLNACVDEGVKLRCDGMLGPITTKQLCLDYETVILARKCGVNLPSREVDSMSSANRAKLRKLAKIFIDVSQETDVSVDWLVSFARIESHFRPHIERGSSKGLFQFQLAAWEDSRKIVSELGDFDDNWSDPYLNSLAMATYLKINVKRLEGLGLDARNEPRWLYMAHQQGADGLMELINADKGIITTKYVSSERMIENAPYGYGVTTNKGQFYRNWMSYLRNFFK
jgi:hypothetical protein